MTTAIRSFLIKYAFGLCVAIVVFGCARPAEKTLSRSDALMKQGKYLEAANLLKELTVIYPNNAQVWNHLGVAYHNYGDLVAASHAYANALKLSNSFPIAHYNLGCAFFEMRNYLQASREFATYVMYETQSVEGWLKLGCAQLYLGQYDSAEKSFKNVLSLNPQNYEAYNGLGITTLYLKRWRESLQYFSNALRIKPDYAPANLNMGVVLLNYQKDKENAAKMFRRFLALKNQSQYHASISNLLSKLEAPPAPVFTNRVGILQTNQIKSQASVEQKTPVATNANAEQIRPIASQPTISSNKQVAAISTTARDTQRAEEERENTVKTVSSSSSVTNKIKSVIPEANPPVVQTTHTVAKVEREIPIMISPPSNPPTHSDSQKDVKSEKENVKISEPETPKPAGDEQKEAATKTEKPGFAKNLFNKINPFKKKTTSQPIVTPLPPDSKKDTDGGGEQKVSAKTSQKEQIKKTQALQPDSGAKEIAMVEARKTGLQPKTETLPNFPKYNYRNPQKPPQGDAVEAQKQFKLGLEDHESGNLVEAKIHYGEAIKANPSYYEATYNLALICVQHNEINRALELYETALAINPDAGNARLNFAIALQKANYVFDAVNEYEKYLKANTNDARVHLLLGNLYAQQLKDNKKAAVHYTEVLRIEPSHPQALTIHQWLKHNAE